MTKKIRVAGMGGRYVHAEKFLLIINEQPDAENVAIENGLHSLNVIFRSAAGKNKGVVVTCEVDFRGEQREF